MGKGSKQRPRHAAVTQEQFDRNWETVFNSRKSDETVSKDQSRPPFRIAKEKYADAYAKFIANGSKRGDED